MLKLFIIEYVCCRECYGHHLFRSAIIAANEEEAKNVLSEITNEKLDVKSVWLYDDLDKIEKASYLTGNGVIDFSSFLQKKKEEKEERERREKEYDERWWDFRVED